MKKLSEYLPSMKLDGYSVEICQERVDKCHTQGFFLPLHKYSLNFFISANSMLGNLSTGIIYINWFYLKGKSKKWNRRKRILNQVNQLLYVHLLFVCPKTVTNQAKSNHIQKERKRQKKIKNGYMFTIKQ